MKIHKFVCFAIGLSLLLFASGCGYQIGSLMHPQIKTIAIAPVVNDTLAYNASAEMRNLLSEQFMRDGSLKVVSLSKADCQVFVRITQVAFSEITERSYDDEDEMIEVVKEDEYIVDGSARLNDISDLIGVSMESEELDSVGGLVIGELGRIPEEKEEVLINNIRFVVEEVDKNRIKKVRIFT